MAMSLLSTPFLVILTQYGLVSTPGSFVAFTPNVSCMTALEA